MNGTEPVKCAIWARVSTEDQSADNQLPILRAWAERLGWEVTREYITEDSAWRHGNGAKGKEFERKRQLMLADLRQGHFTGVLIWHIDRLSRRGPEDMHRYLRLLWESDADVRADQCSWLQDTTDPFVRDLLVGVFGSLAGSQSDLKSKNIKNGMARAKREIEEMIAAGEVPEKKIGGREPGARDKRKRQTGGYEAAWKEGGALRQARERLARTLTCQNPECGKEFTSTVTTEQKYCSMACREAVRALRRGAAGARDAVAFLDDGSLQVSPEQERVARARAGSPDAPWSELASGLGMSRAEAINHYRLMMMKVSVLREEAAQREAAARAVAEASPEMRAVMLAEINRHAFGGEQIAAKRAAQENGAGPVA